MIFEIKSSCGIGRPFSNGHHHRPNFRSTDIVLVWRCESTAAAQKLELELIREFRPQLNIAGIDKNVTEQI